MQSPTGNLSNEKALDEDSSKAFSSKAFSSKVDSSNLKEFAQGKIEPNHSVEVNEIPSVEVNSKINPIVSNSDYPSEKNQNSNQDCATSSWVSSENLDLQNHQLSEKKQSELANNKSKEGIEEANKIEKGNRDSSKKIISMKKPSDEGIQGGSSINKSESANSNHVNSNPANSNLIEEPPTIISLTRPRSSPDAKLVERYIGKQLGHFQTIEPVGVGGMAAVIRAQDLELARIVALKILPPEMAVDPENVKRFRQEARAAAKLDHENIARVYYCGEDQGIHFIAFEFVAGETLRAITDHQGGKLEIDKAISYLLQVTAGLIHAQSRQVVHRDIKPSNIIITPEGKAKIVDMGLARNLDPHNANGGVTHSGVTLGTFDYISPEQAIDPRIADCRSDIYSLGCTFYHVLSGQAPVPEGTAAKKLSAHQHLLPIDPRLLNPAIPDDLTKILARMMAKNPDYRYQSPQELYAELMILAQNRGIEGISTLNPAFNSSILQKKKDSRGSLLNPGFSSAERQLPAYYLFPLAILLMFGFLYFSGFFSKKSPLSDNNSPWPEIKSLVSNSNENLKKLPVDPSTTAKFDNMTKRVSRDAHTVDEFVQLLKIPNVQINLDEDGIYDFTQANSMDGNSSALTFQGTDLIITSKNLNRPAKVILNSSLISELNQQGSLQIGWVKPEELKQVEDIKKDENDSGSSSLPAEKGASENLQFNNTEKNTPVQKRSLRIYLKNITIYFNRPDGINPDAETVGIRLLNPERIQLENCTFFTNLIILPSSCRKVLFSKRR